MAADPRGLSTWLRRHLLAPQTGRDIDLEHWWQLPEDTTRTASPWRQLQVDIVARAPFSEWHERVAERRVISYDRLRPCVTRAVMLVVVAGLLLPLTPPWWLWAMLMPAVAQVALELYLYRYLADSASEPRWQVVRAMRDVARDHFNTQTLNVTGVLGAVACPLLVVATCLAPAGGELGWAKVCALAAAILYLNSGLANVLLDPPNYTESSVMPPVMHSIRPWVPAISLAVVATFVAVGAANDAWERPLLPVAYACSTLTLLLGSTIRNHDRMAAVCAEVAREAVLDGRTALGRIVHDDLGPAKAAAESVSSVPGVPYDAVVDLQALAAYLKHFHTRTGLHASQRMHLHYLVDKLVGPYGISPKEVRFDIGWDEENIRREDHQVAIRMVTALVHNLGQALERSQHRGHRRDFLVRAFTSGSGRQLRYHLAVRDHLPMIADDQWCCPGGSLAALRDWLRLEFNGDLRQVELGKDTKEIVACWDDRSPADEAELG